MSAELLVVEGLTVRHGGLVALHDVSLQVGHHQIAGLIGPNGAGKTTFIDALSGFTGADRGTVTLDGRVLDPLSAHERARRGLVRTFQSVELFDDLTVTQNLEVAVPSLRRWSLLSDLFPARRRHSPEVAETLERLRLSDVADRRPAELSNGRRHLVALGRALVAAPRVLMLDEPAAGLDPDETAELGELLRSLVGPELSILLVDHDMSIVLGVCDVVHVLDFGGIIASGTPTQVRSDPRVVSAYLGAGDHR